MRQITVEEFHGELRAQGVSGPEHLAFRCPRCRTIQSARDLIVAGAGADFEAVERVLAFSCVGRWTGAGPARTAPDGMPCDWTLGGLFRLHELEVVTPEGERCPRFEPVSPAEAQAHEAAQGASHDR